MCRTHGLCRSLLVEEKREGLAEEVARVHPCVASLVRGVVCDVINALSFKKVRVFSCIAIEEIVGAYSKPKQIDLPVGLACLVVHLREVHAGERTV